VPGSTDTVRGMRIGIFTAPSTIDSFVEGCRTAKEQGYVDIWAPQIFGLDTMQVIGIAAREVPGLSFGTSVVPTYPRHPMSMAQMALTTAEATGGRFTLGIGLSHKVVIEGMYGMSFDKPANHMREYLSILNPLLAGQGVNVSGELLTARGQLGIVDPKPVPLVIAAMGPAMLKLAGSSCDGTLLWMTGPKTIASQIIPAMTPSAEAAGRPTPRCIAGIPMMLTNDVADARARAAKEYAIYGQLPSYRSMLDAEGLAGPADLAIIGNEEALRAGIEAMRESGCTDFACAPFGTPAEQAATQEFVATLL
jgi:5,10-methylenetetrahydromethanopterin reductase